MATESLQEYQLVEHDDYWTIPLLAQRVSRFQVDTQLTLEFFDRPDEETTVWVSGKFNLELDRRERLLSAEQRDTVSPVFALLNRTVQSALAYKNGTLEITFTEGGKLSVTADSNYESWGVTGVRWLRIVCMPGGELAVWLAEPPEGKTREQLEAEKKLTQDSRKITTLVNILEPDPAFQSVIFSNELSIAGVLGKSEEELNRRLEAHFGGDLMLSTAQPLYKLLEQIKKVLPDWPDRKPEGA
jgi:hypothetical protein